MPNTLHNYRPPGRLVAMQRVFVGIVLLFCGWMTTGAAAVVPTIRIMVFGDSLSAAYNIDPALGWVSLLGQRLKTTHPQAVVINASISGETTAGGTSRLPADLGRHKPTHVLLQLGANDALRGLPLTETRRNLETMVRQIRTTGAVPILIGIQIPPNYGPDYAQALRELYPAIAKSQKSALVPFLLEGIADKPQLFLPDGLHPTAEAQPLVLENVWPIVQTALRKKS